MRTACCLGWITIGFCALVTVGASGCGVKEAVPARVHKDEPAQAASLDVDHQSEVVVMPRTTPTATPVSATKQPQADPIESIFENAVSDLLSEK